MPLPRPVSAAARQTIKAAFDDLDRTITPADSRDFRATTLQNVRDAALEIERQLAARGSLRNMRRLMPLFKGIEHYSKVMDVLCNGTPYLPWIWAPITLILRVASEHVEAFEQIIKGYAQLAESLVRFEVLDCAFKDNPDFQQTLAVFYADILQFHRHAYKFVRRSGWKLLFLTSWGRFQRRFDNIMEDMGRHGDLIDKEANARNIAEAREMRRDIRLWREQNDERVKSFEEEQAAKQYQSIMAWMNIDESDQLAIMESIMAEGRNYPGTCAWILKNPKVSSWLQKRSESPILWLQGTPGSGKSVISTQLVTFMQTAKMFVMYHFCTYLYMSSTIYEQILRSLLMQLLRKDGDLVAHVHEEFVLGKKSPTVSALERLLQLLFKSVSNEPSQTEYLWIILDGLDECEPDKQARVISLMNQVTSHRSSSSGKAFCKVLISSRSSTTLSKWLRKKQVVSLSEEKHCLEGAIRLYAAQRLQALEQRFRQLDIAPGELDDVELQIAKKADGMFLYARLVLDYLSTNVFYNCDEIKASVNQLPEKINDFYRKILTQVLIHLDSRSVNRIKCVLGWIAFAKRPLKRLEFLSAVTFSSGDPNVAHVAPQYILDICAPLIDERHDTTLTFIHVSVKEFLQTSSCSVTIHEQEALQEHGVAAVTCLLSGLEVFNTTYDEQTRYHRVVKGLHGLHVYATEYWTEYLLSRAKYASGLEASSVLFRLACQIADKLNETADLTRIKQIEIQPIVQDERLAYLQQHPILCERVRAALDARSINQLEYELLQVPGTQILPASDGISAMLAIYQETVKSILDQSDHPGISAQELELFKSQFGTSAFTCRLKSCPRATLGFETEKFRLEHEMTHVRKFRCTFPDCHFPPFVSAQALKNHVNKYHTPSPAPKSIRDIQTPAPRGVRSVHDEEGDGPMHKRRKKNSPRVDSSHLPIDPPPSIRQRFIDNNFYVPRHGPYTVSHEATEKTSNLSPAAHPSYLEAPPSKRDFSPERWRGSSKKALDEALRLQNDPKERIASSLVSPIPPIGQPLEMSQTDQRDFIQSGPQNTENKLTRLPSLRDLIPSSELENSAALTTMTSPSLYNGSSDFDSYDVSPNFGTAEFDNGLSDPWGPLSPADVSSQEHANASVSLSQKPLESEHMHRSSYCGSRSGSGRKKSSTGSEQPNTPFEQARATLCLTMKILTESRKPSIAPLYSKRWKGATQMMKTIRRPVFQTLSVIQGPLFPLIKR
ncbi:hypothetical protein M441DRAFT_299452 [Trichoderma asperellum CBS 433.97]|uniref:Uncharacterized protein n=1 Tax=Trichoderma asperellum (strain ATCC 204424 / CBS 433.97 / NBRC 101777) TaxID=1042311 RepID=A0A2T3ZJ35_TRIA4|nr:hypothetical protein M441DRAFT_299452 [Trichoderma asperellum CBS 433.97]PTB44819.1 hypothetical protein M441DRAFT_299452 [Trichoderma asperellum CBS 433.97]